MNRKTLHKNLKLRWGQYQWENEHQLHIDLKSIVIAVAVFLIIIGLVFAL